MEVFKLAMDHANMYTHTHAQKRTQKSAHKEAHTRAHRHPHPHLHLNAHKHRKTYTLRHTISVSRSVTLIYTYTLTYSLFPAIFLLPPPLSFLFPPSTYAICYSFYLLCPPPVRSDSVLFLYRYCIWSVSDTIVALALCASFCRSLVLFPLLKLMDPFKVPFRKILTYKLRKLRLVPIAMFG